MRGPKFLCRMRDGCLLIRRSEIRLGCGTCELRMAGITAMLLRYAAYIRDTQGKDYRWMCECALRSTMKDENSFRKPMQLRRKRPRTKNALNSRHNSNRLPFPATADFGFRADFAKIRKARRTDRPAAPFVILNVLLIRQQNGVNHVDDAV
jgi:hypothetical protein